MMPTQSAVRVCVRMVWPLPMPPRYRSGRCLENSDNAPKGYPGGAGADSVGPINIRHRLPGIPPSNRLSDLTRSVSQAAVANACDWYRDNLITQRLTATRGVG